MSRALFFLVLGLAPTACRGGSRGKPPAGDAAPTTVTEPAPAAVDPAPVLETVVLDEVEVRLRGAAETALLGRELGRDLARCLVDGGRLVPLPSQVPPGRSPRPARLRVEVAADCPAPCAKIAVVMDAQLTWASGDAPAPAAIVIGDATPIGGIVETAVVAVTLRLQEAVCADLGARITLWSTEDLRPALTGADPALALWALQLVASRPPAPGLSDAVVPWLEREPSLRAAAITALAALRDPRAVPALTAIADVADRTALATVVEAVTTIGGADARDFLEVLASHRDPAVADHARAGLERLARRGDPAPP